LREIEEEGGVSAEIEGLLGVQELPEPWTGMIGILFLCTHSSGEPAPDKRETDAAQYFRLNEIDAIGDSLEPLSGWLVRRVLSDNFNLLESSESNPFAPSICYA
jgi:NADH pyrophosphatase NudC (nudix superfamily)